MRRAVYWILYSASALAFLAALLFWWVFFSERPENTTDPAVLAGDGSVIDYCELPNLDGVGQNAVDIPKANTPGCLYDHFPLPILQSCREPLPPEADDIRGLWQDVNGGHVERIEQCGSRIVVTTAGLIHDSGPNATAGEATNDTYGPLFEVAGRRFCPRTSARAVWQAGILNFHAFGVGPVVVRRYRDGDALIWEYLNGRVTHMKRICRLPEEHKKPNR